MEVRSVGLALIIFAVLVLTGAQLLIKSRLSVHGVVPFDRQMLGYMLEVLLDWRMWLGGLGLLLSSLCWYAAVSRLPLSIAYPFAALSYPLILLGSVFLLREPLHWQAVAGNIVIVFGILLVSSTAS
jgi:drug/metabolite transporter (DMT)-like permease